MNTKAKKTKQTILEKYGPDFYSKIGAKGGRRKHTWGFATNKELASLAGTIGGFKSSRKGIKNGEGRKKVYKPMWGGDDNDSTTKS